MTGPKTQMRYLKSPALKSSRLTSMVLGRQEQSMPVSGMSRRLGESATTGKSYDKAFFRERRLATNASARATVPILAGLFRPRSVVDFGCGDGAWLASFLEQGVEEILGIDGAYVDRGSLLIPATKFLAGDLSQEVILGRSFDLAVSLEVAEHIPEKAASTLVSSIVAAAEAVVFSAAIPGQGGRNHVNEQWPSYWAALFAERGFVLLDCIRYRLWGNEKVMYYYRQNILCFVSRTRLQSDPILQREHEMTKNNPLSMVHPEAFTQKERQLWQLKNLPHLAKRMLYRLTHALGR